MRVKSVVLKNAKVELDGLIYRNLYLLFGAWNLRVPLTFSIWTKPVLQTTN